MTSPPTYVNPHRAPFNSRIADRWCRIGLLLGAIGGLLSLIATASSGVLVTQSGVDGEVQPSIFLVSGVIALVSCGIAATVPYSWARYLGMAAMPFCAFVFAIVVWIATLEDEITDGDPIVLTTTGKLMWAALILTTVGTVLAVAGSPRIGRPFIPTTRRSASGYSVVAAVLGWCALITGGLTSTLAIAFGIGALDDIRRGEGTRSGTAAAVVGIVIGGAFVLFGSITALLIGVDPIPLPFRLMSFLDD